MRAGGQAGKTGCAVFDDVPWWNELALLPLNLGLDKHACNALSESGAIVATTTTIAQRVYQGKWLKMPGASYLWSEERKSGFA